MRRAELAIWLGFGQFGRGMLTRDRVCSLDRLVGKLVDMLYPGNRSQWDVYTGRRGGQDELVSAGGHFTTDVSALHGGGLRAADVADSVVATRSHPAGRDVRTHATS